MKLTKTTLIDKIVALDGDIWRIVGVGVTDADGFIYLQLASTTRFRQQRNGKSPVQIAGFFHPHIIDFGSLLAGEAA